MIFESLGSALPGGAEVRLSRRHGSHHRVHRRWRRGVDRGMDMACVQRGMRTEGVQGVGIRSLGDQPGVWFAVSFMEYFLNLL